MNQFFRNHWVMRIAALLMSFIIWLILSVPQSDTAVVTTGVQKYPYPCSVQVLANPGIVVTQINNPTAVIEVQSTDLNLASLPAQMIGVTVRADARGLGPGVHTVRLKAIGMPAGVDYTIQPSSVTVTLAGQGTTTRDVKVQVEGAPAHGYQTGTPMLDISSVRVTGVTDVLQQVASVQATLSVAGATQTVTRVVSLQAVDSNGRSVSGVTITPPTVTVTVPVQSPQVSASLTPQLVGTPAAGYAVSAVSVQPKTVQLRGDAAAMANLLAISVPVDVQGLKASTVLRVAIPHPTGVSSMTPSTVRVSVTVEPAETKEFSGLPVKVQDAPDGTGVKIVSPQTVDVTVSGAKSILDRLQPQDVTVYVDASNVTAADTSAPLNVAIPNWVQVTNMSDSTAQIQVTESGDKT